MEKDVSRELNDREELTCPVRVEVLNGMTDLKEKDFWGTRDSKGITLIVATNVLNSSVPGLKGGWDFGWRGATQLAPAEGWTQISAVRQTRQDREQKEGRFCRNRQAVRDREEAMRSVYARRVRRGRYCGRHPKPLTHSLTKPQTLNSPEP